MFLQKLWIPEENESRQVRTLSRSACRCVKGDLGDDHCVWRGMVLDGLGKVPGNGAAHHLDSRQRKKRQLGMLNVLQCSAALPDSHFGAVGPMNINL